MSLWGKTDVVGAVPKFINLARYPAGTRVVYVDTTEAKQPGNIKRGLISPGWWLYREVTRGGVLRYNVELVVAMSSSNTQAVAGDNPADDDIVSDFTIVFTTQPANQTVVAGGTATFTVVTNPVVTYQWQVSTNAGVSFANIVGETAATLTLTLVPAGSNGNQYRVIADAVNADPATSSVATLTVTA